MEIQDVYPKNGSDFELEELKEFVGGYIEIVQLNDKQLIVVNEEGKLKNLPHNPIATEAFYLAKGWHDTIVGNALICDVKQIK